VESVGAYEAKTRQGVTLGGDSLANLISEGRL
jgi:hypothetical protein